MWLLSGGAPARRTRSRRASSPALHLQVELRYRRTAGAGGVTPEEVAEIAAETALGVMTPEELNELTETDLEDVRAEVAAWARSA